MHKCIFNCLENSGNPEFWAIYFRLIPGLNIQPVLFVCSREEAETWKHSQQGQTRWCLWSRSLSIIWMHWMQVADSKLQDLHHPLFDVLIQPIGNTTAIGSLWFFPSPGFFCPGYSMIGFFLQQMDTKAAVEMTKIWDTWQCLKKPLFGMVSLRDHFKGVGNLQRLGIKLGHKFFITWSLVFGSKVPDDEEFCFFRWANFIFFPLIPEWWKDEFFELYN